MNEATKKLGRTINHLVSAIEQAKMEATALINDKDLRDINEDFREAAGLGLRDFLEIDQSIKELKERLEELRVAAYVRDLDPSMNLLDSSGRAWTAVVRENDHFRIAVPAIRSAREALGLDLHDAKIAVMLYQAGKL